MGTLKKTQYTPHYPNRNYCHGDSLSDLLGVTSDGVLPWTTRVAYNKNFQNLAKGGYRLDQINAETFGPFQSGMRFFNAIAWGPKPERSFMMGGTNDIIQAASDLAGMNTTLFGALQTKFNLWISNSNGRGVFPYVFTLPPVPESNSTLWIWDAPSTPYPDGFRQTFNAWLLSTFTDAATAGGHVINLETAFGALVDKSASSVVVAGVTIPGPVNARPAAYVRLGNDFVHLSPAGHDAVAAAAAPYVLPDF